MKSSLSLFLPAIAGCLALAPSSPAEDAIVYIGTYTKGKDEAKSDGIYLSRLDLATGNLTSPQLAASVADPSFVAIHPNRQYLYAVSEVSSFGGQPGGAVTAFQIDPASGLLTKLNDQSSGGPGPCHVSIDPSGKCVLVANYGGGSCASYPVKEDGSLREAGSVIQHTGSSINPRRQKEPHAHSINPSPDGRFAFVADLGLDQIKIYGLNAAAGKLTPHGEAGVEPGSGPRHFTFHPSGKWAWVINEMTLMVTGFSYDAVAGTLSPIQTLSTLPDSDREPNGFSTAEILAHPNGKFVYGSNRGPDTIAVFQVDSVTGQLTFVEVEPIQGKTPRSFGIDPSGRWLLAAGQGSNTVSVFRIDQATGALDYTGHQITVGMPVCVRFLSRP